MARGGGGKINKPKAALCKKNLRKERKLKIQALKHLSTAGCHSDSTLQDTTQEILRQCRTNPKANVHLSGKKKRALVKEAKRLRKGKEEKMECVDRRGEEGIENNSKNGMETV